MKRFICLLMVFLSTDSIAQIEYHEFGTPQQSLSFSPVFIDFNNDNSADYYFLFYKSKSSGCSMFFNAIHFGIPKEKIYNKILKSNSAHFFNNLDTIKDNDTIATKCCHSIVMENIEGVYYQFESEIQYYTMGCTYQYSTYGGYVEEISNSYFGVKFLINGNYHYGWIKFKKSYGTNISIISYAYNTQPNQYLKIEDPNPSSGIEDIDEDEISIYPNPIDHILNIESNDIIKEYSIIDINGKTLLNSKINDKNITIKTDYLSKGVYIVKLELNYKIIIKKVIK